MDIEATLSNTSGAYKEAAELSEIEEVLFITLFWRALDSQAPNPILGDPYAQETLDKCIINQKKRFFGTARDPRWTRYSCNRSKTLDKWCQQFIDHHAGEEIQVLHLCCGLDSRCLRVRWGDNVRWIDVDLPAVCDLRRRVMPRPAGDYSLRSLSVIVEGWYRDIPDDRTTLVVCENFLFFMSEPIIHRLFRDLVEYLNAGQFIFDTLGTMISRHATSTLKDMALHVQWAVDDPRSIERWHSKLKMSARVQWQEYMGNELPMGQNLPPIFGPWSTAWITLKSRSTYKQCMQVLRFDFGDRAASVNSSQFTLTGSEHGSSKASLDDPGAAEDVIIEE